MADFAGLMRLLDEVDARVRNPLELAFQSFPMASNQVRDYRELVGRVTDYAVPMHAVLHRGAALSREECFRDVLGIAESALDVLIEADDGVVIREGSRG